MELRQRWWLLGICTGACGEREILCVFSSANFTRHVAGLAGLLSWYNMFLYFYEWAIYVASMEDLHLVENNREQWGSIPQGYRSDIQPPHEPIEDQVHCIWIWIEGMLKFEIKKAIVWYAEEPCPLLCWWVRGRQVASVSSSWELCTVT